MMTSIQFDWYFPMVYDYQLIKNPKLRRSNAKKKNFKYSSLENTLKNSDIYLEHGSVKPLCKTVFISNIYMR